MQPLAEMLVKCRRKFTTDKRKHLNASSGCRDYKVCKSMKLQYSTAGHGLLSTEIVIRKCNEIAVINQITSCLSMWIMQIWLIVSVYSVSTFDLKLEDFGQHFGGKKTEMRAGNCYFRRYENRNIVYCGMYTFYLKFDQ